MVTLLFVVLKLMGDIGPEKAFEVVLMVIVFYFGKSTALDKPQKAPIGCFFIGLLKEFKPFSPFMYGGAKAMPFFVPEIKLRG
ncbi:MAG: hypothetical protein N4A63_08810 [Vallitalea sp.]|jgi:hypothetical protein|nr:hypothetical protein [Vallitalea sp.]